MLAKGMYRDENTLEQNVPKEVYEKLLKDIDDEGNGTLKEFDKKMWEERDNNMTEKIKGYFADSQNTYFVVVGAGHMVGDTGIIAQLETEGICEIKQVK
jgi:uncharacterized protein YbaP (TraB family)